jgi:hypothetical protein
MVHNVIAVSIIVAVAFACWRDEPVCEKPANWRWFKRGLLLCASLALWLTSRLLFGWAPFDSVIIPVAIFLFGPPLKSGRRIDLGRS